MTEDVKTEISSAFAMDGEKPDVFKTKCRYA